MRIYKGVERADGLRVVYETLVGEYACLLTPFAQPGRGPCGQGMDWGRMHQGTLWLALALTEATWPSIPCRERLALVLARCLLEKLPLGGFEVTSDQLEAWFADEGCLVLERYSQGLEGKR